jgi:hypothetical protein
LARAFRLSVNRDGLKAFAEIGHVAEGRGLADAVFTEEEISVESIALVNLEARYAK